MDIWRENIQQLVDEIDLCIHNGWDAELTLSALAGKLGYSEYYISRKFREVSGMQLRRYLRQRRLAFALKTLRDTDGGILDIALDYGFSSHEAFTRAFRNTYGITPSAYRKKPVPVTLRTILRPFDYRSQGSAVEAKIEKAMAEFDWENSGYRLDTTEDRVFYFYHDCTRFFRYVRPVRKV